VLYRLLLLVKKPFHGIRIPATIMRTHYSFSAAFALGSSLQALASPTFSGPEPTVAPSLSEAISQEKRQQAPFSVSLYLHFISSFGF
jgi:hypothetical protein